MIAVVTALSGAIVHSNVVPLARLEDPAKSGYEDMTGTVGAPRKYRRGK